jgi:galactokinase
MEHVRASAPGRICLFGEHQDFLGLPVIACAIDVRIAIEGRLRSDGRLVLHMPDIADEDAFEVDGDLPYRGARDYVRSTVNVLRREGMQFCRGYDCTMTSTIPINAGVSSSSAMIVAWMSFLLATQEHGIERDPPTVALLAHRAEVLEFNEPGGTMDHYTSATGGLLYIKTADPLTVTPLPATLHGFVLGNSLQTKETTEVLAKSKSDVLAGLEVLKQRIPDFDLQTTPAEAIAPHYSEMTGDSARKVAANIVNRDLCQEARELLSAESPDPAKLGRLLTAHHGPLRDGLGVSTDKIERLLDASAEAGSLGGKINGSGGGGCMFAYAPGKQEAVKASIDAAGGDATIVSVDRGAAVEIL